VIVCDNELKDVAWAKTASYFPSSGELEDTEIGPVAVQPVKSPVSKPPLVTISARVSTVMPSNSARVAKPTKVRFDRLMIFFLGWMDRLGYRIS